MPENTRGTLTPFRLPPESAVWDELTGPISEYRKLVSDRHMALTRLGKLENDRVRAVDADRRKLAKALREGKDDPGDTAVERIDKDMANTRRLVESLEIAIEEAEQELIGIVDEHQAEWLESADEKIEAETEEYLAAIDSLEAARSKLAGSVGLKRFLHTFPEHGYSAGHWPVFGLLAQHGDPYFWQDVIEALRKDAEVGKRPEREEQVAQASGPIRELTHNLPVEPGYDSVLLQDKARLT